MTSTTPQPTAIDPPPEQSQDMFLYRLLVGGLVAAVILTIAGIFTLALLARTIPEGLVALGSAAVGGLVGLLVPAPR